MGCKSPDVVADLDARDELPNLVPLDAASRKSSAGHDTSIMPQRELKHCEAHRALYIPRAKGTPEHWADLGSPRSESDGHARSLGRRPDVPWTPPTRGLSVTAHPARGFDVFAISAVAPPQHKKLSF